MRRAVLTALASVVLVTAAGTLGATVVGDATRDTGRDTPSPFIDGDGLIGSDPDTSTDGDGGALGPVEDALHIGESTGDAAENGSRAGPERVESDRESDDSPGSGDASADGNPDDPETSAGTGPAADSDGDGLSDSRERELGTDPGEVDSDGDGLDDDQELTVGTDPTEADTDGDRLLDSWEVAGRTPAGAELPGADPLAKDVYVQFDYASGTERRSEGFYDAIATEFAEMPVDNPDNSTGIEVHVRDDGGVNDTARFTGENFWTLKDRYYESELGVRAGVYHQVLVVRFSEEQVGYGEVGGRFNVVAGGLRNETAQHAVNHELLHNVVGRVEARGACPDDPKHYCEGGYLSPRFDPGEEQYLADGLVRQLERQGFAE